MNGIEERTLHERLAAVRAAIERDARRSPETARAILDQRARLLARPVHDVGSAERDALDLLVCEVAAEPLAIPLGSIVAIARVAGIARLPRAVAPVYGVTAWRGRPLTVLSLGTGRIAVTDQTRLVVLGTGARAALAIAVDAVDDVRRIAHADLSPAGPGPRQRHALGVTPDGLLVVSGDTLLYADTLSS
jgi:chemotaxis signal transduction protein